MLARSWSCQQSFSTPLIVDPHQDLSVRGIRQARRRDVVLCALFRENHSHPHMMGAPPLGPAFLSCKENAQKTPLNIPSPRTLPEGNAGERWLCWREQPAPELPEQPLEGLTLGEAHVRAPHKLISIRDHCLANPGRAAFTHLPTFLKLIFLSMVT